jgi:hypothetical protein
MIKALPMGDKGRRKIGLKIASAILAMWVVPALLSAMQGGLAMRSFLSDWALHTRYLIAVPLFILAEYTCLPLLQDIACHFDNLAPDDERSRCHANISSIESLSLSKIVILVLTLCAYASVLSLVRYVPLSGLPLWQKAGGEGLRLFSPAGWWQWIISMPLLDILIFAWLWRLFVWSRFLCRMSRLHLRLIPSHPDGVAGLRFLGYSPIAFIPLCLALGAILAGVIANRVIHSGESPFQYKNLVISLVIAVVILFCGPLTLFTGRLFDSKRRGITRYSALASRMGCQFEHKWLDHPRESAGYSLDESALEVPDFSATADLYQVVDNIYHVRLLPLDIKSLVLLVAASLLPFLPVAFLEVPFRTIIQKVISMLI